MTTLVLLVLAIVWGALLVSWLRSRSQGGAFSDSVGTFNRHLKVLGRTTPGKVAPANRLRSGPVAGVSGSYSTAASRPTPLVGPRRHRSAAEVALRRRAAQRRRREVLMVLLGSVVVSMGVAVATGVMAVWALQVILDLAFAGYVALLIHMRNLAAERELRLTFMPEPARAARPRPSYELSSGYGDLELRRAN